VPEAGNAKTRRKKREGERNVPSDFKEVVQKGKPLGSKMIDENFKALLRDELAAGGRPGIFTAEEYGRISPQTLDQVLIFVRRFALVVLVRAPAFERPRAMSQKS